MKDPLEAVIEFIVEEALSNAVENGYDEVLELSPADIVMDMIENEVRVEKFADDPHALKLVTQAVERWQKRNMP